MNDGVRFHPVTDDDLKQVQEAWVEAVLRDVARRRSQSEHDVDRWARVASPS